jgi:hypothetical protein
MRVVIYELKANDSIARASMTGEPSQRAACARARGEAGVPSERLTILREQLSSSCSERPDSLRAARTTTWSNDFAPARDLIDLAGSFTTSLNVGAVGERIAAASLRDASDQTVRLPVPPAPVRAGNAKRDPARQGS